MTREEKGRLRVNCLNWKSCVLKTGFFRQKSEKQKAKPEMAFLKKLDEIERRRF